MKSFQERIEAVAALLTTGEWHPAHMIHTRARLAGADWSADATRGALDRLVQSGRAARELRRSLVPGKPGVLARREVWCYSPTT